MKLKALVVEDEANSREILRNYLAKYCPDIILTAEASSIQEGLILIKENDPDLVFLDVEMPFGNGFDLLDQVPERTFETVFVTAYDHYAKDALNNQAAYYLTKPIAIEELIKAVAHVKEIREKENALHDKVLPTSLSQVQGKLTLPQLDGFIVLNTDEILYCKADDNYTEIYLADKKHLVSKTLRYFEQALEAYPFARIHKSYVVNVNEIVRYHRGKGGSVVLSNGKEIQVAASRKK
ncbi:MAG: LytTR family DNA-binding domain-containing protein, partial [Flavobacteriaceae bacterium]|nr:LytTR family DNA-binding domain-containing protein [Flavobacteriaceae bacterium]